MTRDEIKKDIVRIVENCNGLKATELVAHPQFKAVVISKGPTRVILECIEELVKSGDIVEIEYVIAGTDRIKSFLLPANTKVRPRGSTMIFA